MVVIVCDRHFVAKWSTTPVPLRNATLGIGKKRTQKGTMYKGVGLKEEVRAKLTEGGES